MCIAICYVGQVIILVVKALANVNEYHAAQTTQTQNKDKSNIDMFWKIVERSTVTEYEWPMYITWKQNDYAIIPWYKFYDFERFGI